MDDSAPVPIVEREHVWVPMPDGCRLSARIWMPADAERRPVPAVLEYIPYRKRDFTVVRDSLMHPYFAARGYASIRLDSRGAGDSEGVMTDEYTRRELEDGRDAIEWFAGRGWCTGKVGMLGGSWGGFNSLQVAALRPPSLKAIITVVSTDDRYADDMHYMGGCLLGDMMSWGQQFFTQLGRPPDPEIVGDSWRAMWRERLEAMEPVIGRWLRHQRRDEFWKHGSICEDYAAIRCAVYAVGGWADGYSNAVFRMLRGLAAPTKALVGPWGHGRPHFAVPGPQIGWLQEALRWWDHWLKGADTGIMDEPRLRVWLQESQPPATRRPVWPGRWVAEPGWPSANVATRPASASRPGRWSTRRARGDSASTRRSPPASRRASGARTDSARSATTCRWTSGSTTAVRWCSTRRRSESASRSSARRRSSSSSRPTRRARRSRSG